MHHEGLVRKVCLGFDDNLARLALVIGTVNRAPGAVLVGIDGQEARLVGHADLVGKGRAVVPRPVACSGKKADCHGCLYRFDAGDRCEVIVGFNASFFGAAHRFVDGVAPSVVARHLKIHSCEVGF